MMFRFHIITLSILFTCGLNCVNGADQYMTIRVIDADTQRGVPLVQLMTVNHRSFITDNHGVVAFDEAGLMNRRVFFHVFSHGYQFPKDGFGYRGRAIPVKAGGTVTLKLQRINVAERLYRVTGEGKYRDSRRLGLDIPVREKLPGGVLGSDSVLTETIGDTIYWFWGDTNRAGYPLGNFHVPGASSKLPDKGGLAPHIGVDLAYFLNEKGVAKQTCKMPGRGPTWLDCLMKIEGQGKSVRLFAMYMKVEAPLHIYERGIVEFNLATQNWEHRITFPDSQIIVPHGHPFKHRDADGWFFYFAGGMPNTRVPATVKDILDPTRYQAYTCLTQTTNSLPNVRRDNNNELAFRWTTRGPVLSVSLAQKLVQAGKLSAKEIPGLIDIETGKLISPHHGSVYYNAYRRKYVMIISQSMGHSMLGEVWFSEAATPSGPWKYARRIITHDNYSFYNPKQHPMLDVEGGRTIFFEGTYTTTFSGNPHPTPGYDYNQIMYKLDLTDARLNLPVPVYSESLQSGLMVSQSFQLSPAGKTQTPIFYALTRAGAETRQIELNEHSFWIAKTSGPHLLPLWKWTRGGQTPLYLPQGTTAPAGYKKQLQAIGYIWKK
jgi:hypothetical protein